MNDNRTSETSTRCGFVAIAGAPNAGKSTLLNALVGSKLSIVSHKVQTTRMRVRGVALEGKAQLVFVDTPGIFSPKRALDEAMVDAAWEGVTDADVRFLLADATAFRDHLRGEAKSKGSARAVADTHTIIEAMINRNLHTVLVVNKIDQVKREHLLEIIAHLGSLAEFEETFLVSAQTGDGLGDLLKYAAGQVPPGPWLYPEDQLSDISLRLMAAEITREKLILRLHDELPYASTVETTLWEERPKGGVRIEQTVFVERETQKAIVLGKGGQTIKEIGSQSRADIAEVLGQEVHLFLTVKVTPKWMRDPERFAAIGLQMPKR